jgi:hypothetical protein
MRVRVVGENPEIRPIRLQKIHRFFLRSGCCTQEVRALPAPAHCSIIMASAGLQKSCAALGHPRVLQNVDAGLSNVHLLL